MTADHPDHEQLAAFQAGDGDRRQRADVEAHLAGCPSCAELVASVGWARGRLALLAEPDLPPGLHDRLAAAVDAEIAEAAGSVPARPPSRLRRPVALPATGGPEGRGGTTGRSGAERRPERRARPVPWYRRPVAWGAAAALLLAALVAVPLLDQSSDPITAGGGGQAAQEADTAQAAGAGNIPLLRIPGEVSAATVRSRLDADPRARTALDSAAGAPGTQPAAPRQAEGADSTAEGLRSSTSSPPAGSADLPACLPAAAAAADPATRPLTPAFYVEGSYQGRQATILVTTSTGQPGRVDLWVFPRNDCSAPPLATERVR